MSRCVSGALCLAVSLYRGTPLWVLLVYPLSPRCSQALSNQLAEARDKSTRLNEELEECRMSHKTSYATVTSSISAYTK